MAAGQLPLRERSYADVKALRRSVLQRFMALFGVEDAPAERLV